MHASREHQQFAVTFGSARGPRCPCWVNARHGSIHAHTRYSQSPGAPHPPCTYRVLKRDMHHFDAATSEGELGPFRKKPPARFVLIALISASLYGVGGIGHAHGHTGRYGMKTGSGRGQKHPQRCTGVSLICASPMVYVCQPSAHSGPTACSPSRSKSGPTHGLKGRSGPVISYQIGLHAQRF